MTRAKITDEIVQLAVNAMWSGTAERQYMNHYVMMRRALEAVADKFAPVVDDAMVERFLAPTELNQDPGNRWVRAQIKKGLTAALNSPQSPHYHKRAIDDDIVDFLPPWHHHRRKDDK